MKITKATIKSFIRKNIDNLYINVQSSFDGMTDCCESREGGFTKAVTTQDHPEHTIGVSGAWFVGDSRDYFSAFENDTFKGYEVYNCCGHFNLAVKK